MTLALLASLLLSSSPTPRLVLHEWGTFTTVAGTDGFELEWSPLEQRSDLPSFVYSAADERQGLRFGHVRASKGERATIRMETPVVYFYADHPMDVELSVAFPGGAITEWYPQAISVSNTGGYGFINWGKFKVLPHTQAELPTEPQPSHYYPARETDSALVRVCGEDTTEVDKFLFYRGVATTPLPLVANVSGDSVKVGWRQGMESAGKLIVFERRGDLAGFSSEQVGREGGTVKRPGLTRRWSDVLAPLRELLLAEGLYEKEADAMLKTWRDSWFEDGLRIFYVLPSAQTQRLLPMNVSPTPTESVRVLVGRVELFTREDVAAFRGMSDATAQRKYGRFFSALRQLSR